MKAKTLIGRSTFSKLPELRISVRSAKHRHRKFKQIMEKGKFMANENQMDQGPAVPPQAEEKAEARVTHKAAEDLPSAAGAMTDDYLGRAEGIWDDARHRVRSFRDNSEQYVRENPTKAVFTALGVGLVLGLIFRR